jgi:hypothetical protein
MLSFDQAELNKLRNGILGRSPAYAPAVMSNPLVARMTIPVLIHASNEVVVNGDRNGIQLRSVAIKEAVIGAVVAARAIAVIVHGCPPFFFRVGFGRMLFIARAAN